MTLILISPSSREDEKKVQILYFLLYLAQYLDRDVTPVRDSRDGIGKDDPRAPRSDSITRAKNARVARVNLIIGRRRRSQTLYLQVGIHINRCIRHNL